MTFPVDVVYTWVNHADPAWIEAYRAVTEHGDPGAAAHPSVDNLARFQNRNELVYSLRSLNKYAPWVNRVYVVSNCELPAEVSGDEKVTHITHEDVFPDPAVLPTFNSRAIESNFHRIPHLVEHVLYLNDDVFICKPVAPADFFPETGSVWIFPSKHDIPYEKKRPLRPVDYGALNACDLLIHDFAYRPEKKLHHAPFPLLKRSLVELEEKYRGLFDATRSHRFRDNRDLPMATTLHAYYSLVQGRGKLRNVASRYVDIGHPLFPLLIHPLSPLRRGKYQFLCINEVTTPKVLARFRDKLVSNFLETMFSE